MHAAAMGSMALLLIRGTPGGISISIQSRAAYVAQHPWLWRLGWLPWQLTVVSDLLLAIALLCTRWIPRLPGAVALVATLAGMIPDQTGQLRWTWIGPAVAAHALRAGGFATYAAFESRNFLLIAGWGTIGYLSAALAWTWAFAAAETWSRRLTRLSLITWPVFGLSTLLLLLAPRLTGSPTIGSATTILTLVGAGNGIAFVLLMVWLFAVTDAVIRRSRPDAIYGRYAPFRHPSAGLVGRACDYLANSRTVRALGEWLPSFAMASDITNVVYVNYLVEAERLESLVMRPLQLQPLGTEGRFALFTFLTYRHGHFGPRCFGPFRRLWPSPIQSNWRIYVYDPHTGRRGIQFLTIAVTGTPYALVARTLAENIPMHIPANASLSRSANGNIRLKLTPGRSTAPDVEGEFQPCEAPALTPPWNTCFGSWRAMLEYCVPQDRAMSAQPWYQQITRQEIALDIPWIIASRYAARLSPTRPVRLWATRSRSALAWTASLSACFTKSMTRTDSLGHASC